MSDWRACGRRSVLLACVALALVGARDTLSFFGSAPAFAATSECAQGAGPVCYTETGCVEWAIRWIAVPPFLWPYCARYDVIETRYWELDAGEPDSGGSGGEGEARRVAPEES